MIKIVDSKNRRGVEALLSPERVRDQATERRVMQIVADVRRNGDKALTRYARQLDGLSGSIEVSIDEMRRASRDVPAPVRTAIRTPARCTTTRSRVTISAIITIPRITKAPSAMPKGAFLIVAPVRAGSPAGL